MIDSNRNLQNDFDSFNNTPYMNTTVIDKPPTNERKNYAIDKSPKKESNDEIERPDNLESLIPINQESNKNQNQTVSDTTNNIDFDSLFRNDDDNFDSDNICEFL